MDIGRIVENEYVRIEYYTIVFHTLYSYSYSYFVLLSSVYFALTNNNT